MKIEVSSIFIEEKYKFKSSFENKKQKVKIQKVEEKRQRDKAKTRKYKDKNIYSKNKRNSNLLQLK